MGKRRNEMNAMNERKRGSFVSLFSHYTFLTSSWYVRWVFNARVQAVVNMVQALPGLFSCCQESNDRR